MNLKQKRVIVTGATSGIGKAIVDELLEYEEIQIIVTFLPNTEPPVPHPQVIAYPCDVSSQSDLDRLLEFAQLAIGGIDLLISNAGFTYYEEINYADYERLAKIFQTNTFASIYLAEKMKDLYPQGDYKLVFTASAMAHLPIPGYALYSATKAALHAFARAYRYELNRPSQLCLVYPIATRTKFFQTAGTEIPVPFPVQTAEKVAMAVIKGISQDKLEIYPSRIFRVIKFLNNCCPLIGIIYQKIEYSKLNKWLTRKTEAI